MIFFFKKEKMGFVRKISQYLQGIVLFVFNFDVELTLNGSACIHSNPLRESNAKLTFEYYYFIHHNENNNNTIAVNGLKKKYYYYWGLQNTIYHGTLATK